MRYCILILLFFFNANTATAQQVADTLAPINLAAQPDTDTSKLPCKKRIFEPDAKRAGLYSALIPGFGQLYNRQYWKMPIVYAIMGSTIYLVAKRNTEYQRYRTAYVARIADPNNSQDEFQGILSLPAIKQYQDEAKQNMDMMVVFTVVAYAGQIMEAISGAHLRNFDISKDLSMQVSPILTPIHTVGLGLVVNFKK